MSRSASLGTLLTMGGLTLLCPWLLHRWMLEHSLEAARAIKTLEDAEGRSLLSVGELRYFVDLKSNDVARLQGALTSLTRTKKASFEMGLQLQEEKRILEKIWEMMTTYLLVDLESQKLHLMRGDQALESYPIAEVRTLGPETKPQPSWARITSKERFAHPERGTAEEKDGKLVWNPPQVGTSVRANALGEFVAFTSGSMILHGPPKKVAEHEAFPHICLGLGLPVARKVYSNTFIGTRVVWKTQPLKTEPSSEGKAVPVAASSGPASAGKGSPAAALAWPPSVGKASPAVVTGGPHPGGKALPAAVSAGSRSKRKASRAVVVVGSPSAEKISPAASSAGR